jgi:hypothetical protein
MSLRRCRLTSALSSNNPSSNRGLSPSNSDRLLFIFRKSNLKTSRKKRLSVSFVFTRGISMQENAQDRTQLYFFLTKPTFHTRVKKVFRGTRSLLNPWLVVDIWHRRLPLPDTLITWTHLVYITVNLNTYFRTMLTMQVFLQMIYFSYFWSRYTFV